MFTQSSFVDVCMDQSTSSHLIFDLFLLHDKLLFLGSVTTVGIDLTPSDVLELTRIKAGECLFLSPTCPVFEGVYLSSPVVFIIIILELLHVQV